MNFILLILFVYLSIYSLYFLTISIASLNSKKFRIRFNDEAYDNPKNLCVVVYSHNNRNKLELLISQLKNQTYGQASYKIYAILDNCNDGSDAIFQGDSTVEVFSIRNMGTIGKDQAISILVEKLSQEQSIDAYVFLDAKRFVEPDFLVNVNKALTKNNVITGSTSLMGERLIFKENIINVYNKYFNNFIQKSRGILGLSALVDSDILIISKKVVEAIGCVNFQNLNTELKYSVLLSSIGAPCVFNPTIKTYLSIEDFKIRIPSLSNRWGLFINAVGKINPKQFKYAEHIYSLIAPNIWLVIFGYAFLLRYSYKYYFVVDFSLIIASLILLLLGFGISLLNAKIHSKEYLYLFAYPFYSVCRIMHNLPPVRFIRRILNPVSIPSDVQKLVVDVMVTDGRNDYPCKLELISEDGFARVCFINKNKKFITRNNHLRMLDAIKELKQKLNDYNLELKICQCCKYFRPNIDGSTNMIRGFCDFPFVNRGPQEVLPTLLWKSCAAFKPCEHKNIIDEITK